MRMESVVDSLQDMYAGFLANDRAQFDEHLASEVTTWETHLPYLMNRSELDSYRENRIPEMRPVLADLQIQNPQIEVWGDVAVARYEPVSFPVDSNEAVERRGVTDVLRQSSETWLIAHHYAELWKVVRDV